MSVPSCGSISSPRVLDARVQLTGSVEHDVFGSGPARHLPSLHLVEHPVGREHPLEGRRRRRDPRRRVGAGVGLFAGPYHDAPPCSRHRPREPPRLWIAHGVAQRAERAGGQLDHVTRRKPPADLDSAAPRDGAEPDHRASRQPLAGTGIGDDVCHRVPHSAGAPGAPHLAVDAYLDFQGVQERQQLRRRDDDRAERGPEVLGLRRPHEALDHLAELHVAGAEVVNEHEAAHRTKGLLRCQIGAVPGDD